MGTGKVRRRRFLQAGATAAAAAATVSCNSEKSPWRFFTIAEVRTLEAICEQIVPADADPGARQAGVVFFIDRQLMGFHRTFREAYRFGLAGIEETSRKLNEFKKASKALQETKAASSSPEAKKLAHNIAATFGEHMDADLNVKGAFDALQKTLAALCGFAEKGKLSHEDAQAALADLEKANHVLQVLF